MSTPKDIESMTPLEIYRALLAKFGMTEADRDSYVSLVDNFLVTFYDTSYHGSSTYEEVSRKEISPEFVGMIKVLKSNEFFEKMKKASAVWEIERTERELKEAERRVKQLESDIEYIKKHKYQ